MLGRQLYVRHTRQLEFRHLLQQVWSSAPEHLPALLDRLAERREDWTDEAEKAAADPNSSAAKALRSRLALARRSPDGLDDLMDRLLEAEPAEHQLIKNELRRWSDRLTPALWQALEQPEASPGRRFALRLGLGRLRSPQFAMGRGGAASRGRLGAIGSFAGGAVD